MGLDDVPGDGQAETRPAAPPARLVGLVEPFEDPRLVGLRDADPVVLDRHDDLLPATTATRHDDLAAVRAELDRVVEEVDHDLTEPILRAADRRHGRPATSVRSSTPWRSANSRSRSTEATASATEVDLVEHDATVRRTRSGTGRAAPRPSGRGGRSRPRSCRSGRASGRDRLAGGVGLADERLGQQADGRQRRPQLVRQVVDELGPDPLEAAQLGDVLHDQPDAAVPATAGRGSASVGPSSRRRVSSPLAAPDSRAVSTTVSIVGSMNASIALRPTSEPAGRPRNWCGGRIGEVDPERRRRGGRCRRRSCRAAPRDRAPPRRVPTRRSASARPAARTRLDVDLGRLRLGSGRSPARAPSSRRTRARARPGRTARAMTAARTTASRTINAMTRVSTAEHRTGGPAGRAAPTPSANDSR